MSFVPLAWNGLRVLLLVLGLGADAALAGGSMRCDSRIIDEGAPAALVLGACGEPDYRDVWDRGAYGDPYEGSEDWYYNSGPSQLLRVVRLREGRVVLIESDGYGFTPPRTPGCAPLQVQPGLSVYRLISYCGAPAQRRREDGFERWPAYDRPGHPYGGYPQPRTRFVVPVHREEWIYNFGARYLMRIVRLEDGRVVDVQNGDRGFD